MLEELYKIYRSELIHWCTGMTHNRNAAEDLVQEAFYKALQNEELLTTMDLPQRRAWLYRVTKNLFVDHTRRAAFEQHGRIYRKRLTDQQAAGPMRMRSFSFSSLRTNGLSSFSAIWMAIIPQNWESSSPCPLAQSARNCHPQENI